MVSKISRKTVLTNSKLYTMTNKVRLCNNYIYQHLTFNANHKKNPLADNGKRVF